MDAAVEAQLQNYPDVNMDSDMIDDDDRSSSLSDIEDEAESPSEETPIQLDPPTEADSEAETERIDSTPNKMGGSKKMVLNTKPFEPSPSKLAQAVGPESGDEDDSDSAISSPLASTGDSVNGDNADGEEDLNEELDGATVQQQNINGKKRKRSLLDGDELAGDAKGRSRRQRTGSVQSDVFMANDGVSEDESLSSREGTLEPKEAVADVVDSQEANEGDVETIQEPAGPAKDVKDKAVAGRRRALRGKTADEETQINAEEADTQDPEAVGSDAEEAPDNEDVDDAEATAKSEEELAKRMAAMEALTSLEKHFAALRDRLYDERIVSINSELAQLNSKKATHPELLRQLKIVQKYRDDKFDIEQKLLVHRVGALKRKSVAERAELHSSYFQTVRDLREKHLEKISEHFYRIQRERFKTEDPIPNYTIPFPKDRAQQISHQVAYNKEVSILSGVAKYVGFPAAPELSNIRPSELDQDLARMGVSALLKVRFDSTDNSKISANDVKAARRNQGQTMPTAFAATLSRPAAEEQFLEQTPWANPQHPLSQHLRRISRQASEQSRVQETPAVQRLGESAGPHGSASTILEPNNSAAASSAFNTPFGDQVTHAPLENGDSWPAQRLQSMSPTENRKVIPLSAPPSNAQAAVLEQRRTEPMDSSPLVNRATPITTSPRIGPATLDRIPRHENESPLDMHRNNAGILASGMGGLRFGMR